MVIPPSLKFSGNKDAGKSWIKFGLAQLAILQNQMSFQKLKQARRVVSPIHGVVVECFERFGMGEIRIYVQPFSVLETPTESLNYTTGHYGQSDTVSYKIGYAFRVDLTRYTLYDRLILWAASAPVLKKTYFNQAVEEKYYNSSLVSGTIKFDVNIGLGVVYYPDPSTLTEVEISALLAEAASVVQNMSIPVDYLFNSGVITAPRKVSTCTDCRLASTETTSGYPSYEFFLHEQGTNCSPIPYLAYVSNTWPRIEDVSTVNYGSQYCYSVGQMLASSTGGTINAGGGVVYTYGSSTPLVEHDLTKTVRGGLWFAPIQGTLLEGSSPFFIIHNYGVRYSDRVTTSSSGYDFKRSTAYRSYNNENTAEVYAGMGFFEDSITLPGVVTPVEIVLGAEYLVSTSSLPGCYEYPDVFNTSKGTFSLRYLDYYAGPTSDPIDPALTSLIGIPSVPSSIFGLAREFIPSLESFSEHDILSNFTVGPINFIALTHWADYRQVLQASVSHAGPPPAYSGVISCNGTLNYERTKYNTAGFIIYFFSPPKLSWVDLDDTVNYWSIYDEKEPEGLINSNRCLILEEYMNSVVLQVQEYLDLYPGITKKDYDLPMAYSIDYYGGISGKFVFK
jgi:hypothetical protein